MNQQQQEMAIEKQIAESLQEGDQRLTLTNQHIKGEGQYQVLV